MAEPVHLWEGYHPYYCGGETWGTLTSWDQFIEEYGESDPDHNLVIRWDWLTGAEASEYLDMEKDEDDQSHPDLTRDALMIGFALPRKDRLGRVVIRVTRHDEPRIRAWLEEKLAHFMKHWVPLGPAGGGKAPMPRKGIPAPVLRTLEAAALACKLIELAVDVWWNRTHPDPPEETPYEEYAEGRDPCRA